MAIIGYALAHLCHTWSYVIEQFMCRKSFKLSQSEKQKSRLRKGKGNQKSEQVKEEMRRQASLVNSHIQSLFENQSENLLTQLAKFHTAEVIMITELSECMF